MMENKFSARVNALRELMKQRNIAAYIILTDDFHASEYIDEHFKCREYVSGFTGSAGTLVITEKEACLWTDGRYFIQASMQIEGSGIKLMKAGVEGVPEIPKYLAKELKPGDTLGYDGRTVNYAYAKALKAVLKDKEVIFAEDLDLVGEIWEDRPSMPNRPVWELSESFAGESRKNKLARLRAAMKEQGASAHLLTSLDDVAWLYNLRGDDIEYCPMPLAYTIVEIEKAVLYIGKTALKDELVDRLAADGVCVKEYFEIYEDLKEYDRDSTFLIDTNTTNVALMALLEPYRVVFSNNPTTKFKAVKNATEMANERIAHIMDGVAVTKLIYRLKTDMYGGGAEVTERYVADRLLELRKQNENFIEESFSPIIATGEHGAIVHYEAVPDTDCAIVRDNFLLMDTGGHYYQGTTDVTRTVSIGNVTDEMKCRYTAVLRGNLRLAAARFPRGVGGTNLDILARGPLWEMGLDYGHGTGHGVGYLLNVHEGPQNIRIRNRNGDVAFEEGMITSDEPGLYIEGEYGIRLENLLLCISDYKSQFGDFLKFETLTMVPFDRDSIMSQCMTKEELKLLNEYHKKVYDNISPYLNEDEREWLYNETKEMLYD